MKFILLFISLFFILNADTQTYKTSFDCNKVKNKNSIEWWICTDDKLAQLDIKMTNFYNTYKLFENKTIKSEQKQWLKKRNTCKYYDCIEKSYRDRLNDLTNQYIRTININDANMTNQEARDVIQKLVSLAENKKLSLYEIPGNRTHNLNEKDKKVYTDLPEKVRKDFHIFYYDPYTWWKLKISNQEPSKTFISFPASGTCSGHHIFNAQFLGDEDKGIDYINYEDIRWARWGKNDYPVLIDGRFFLITYYRLKNNISMISWIKPNGKIRRLCLTARPISKRKIAVSKNQKLCKGVANSSLQPITFHSYKLPTDLNISDEHLKYDKDNINQMLQIDLNHDGKLDNVAGFSISSSAGCGFDDDWIKVLSKDFTSFSDSLVNKDYPNYALGGQVKTIYKYKGKFYLETFEGEIPNGIVQLEGNSFQQICKFDEIRKITITKFFDFDKY